MKKRIGLTMVCAMLAIGCMAQQSRTVNATGTAVGSDVGHVTKEALYNAKKNALSVAGIEEHIYSQGVVFVGSDNTAAREYGNAELSMLMLDGQVRVKRQRCDTAFINGMVQVTARIRAEVMLEERADEEFRLRVSGLKSIYREGERVEFDIEPSQECYLRVFWFTPPNSPQSEGGQLYPMQGKYRDRLFHPDSVYHFPQLPPDCRIGNLQKLEPTNDGTAPVEYNVLFVVALKKKIPYDKPEYTYEQFMAWLWDIKARDRAMQFGLIGIVK